MAFERRHATHPCGLSGTCRSVQGYRRTQRIWRWGFAVAAPMLFAVGQAKADTDPLNMDDQAPLPTASLYGGAGLLDMRNARFFPDGTLSLEGTVKQPDDRIA